jgi:hypothetical protein
MSVTDVIYAPWILNCIRPRMVVSFTLMLCLKKKLKTIRNLKFGTKAWMQLYLTPLYFSLVWGINKHRYNFTAFIFILKSDNK